MDKSMRNERLANATEFDLAAVIDRFQSPLLRYVGQLLGPDTGEADANEANAGLSAPMNGTVVTLMVEIGVPVEAGTALLVMEAMKMEHTIKAPEDGQVDEFYYSSGDLVDGGAELLQFTPAAPNTDEGA